MILRLYAPYAPLVRHDHDMVKQSLTAAAYSVDVGVAVHVDGQCNCRIQVDQD